MTGKPYVDQDACISCNLCVDMVPEVFRMNADGVAEAYNTDRRPGREDSGSDRFLPGRLRIRHGSERPPTQHKNRHSLLPGRGGFYAGENRGCCPFPAQHRPWSC